VFASAFTRHTIWPAPFVTASDAFERGEHLVQLVDRIERRIADVGIVAAQLEAGDAVRIHDGADVERGIR
jgi:hypothetical protein